MNTYRVTFTGRLRNAIGICYQITDVVAAEDEAAANLKLYDKYEQIGLLKFELLQGEQDARNL